MAENEGVDPDEALNAFMDKVQTAFEDYCAAKYADDEDLSTVVFPGEWIFASYFTRQNGVRQPWTLYHPQTSMWIAKGLIETELIRVDELIRRQHQDRM